MSITANTSLLASEYIPQEIRQQNNEYSANNEKRAGTLTDGKTVSDAARGTSVGGNAAAERDVVTISEEARNMQKNASQEQDGDTGSGNPLASFAGGKTDESKSPADAAASAREQLLKQIKEIKEKIANAEDRLAAATASAGTDVDANGESVEAAATAGLQSAVEVEAIQQEIEQLNQQLQTLYQQLNEQNKGGGGSAPMGTAGIGGEANGPSGQGERISVTG